MTADFYRSIAIYLRKSDEPPLAAGMEKIRLAPKGAKPETLEVDTFEITAKVEAVNYKKRTLTLKGPAGNITVLKVAKSVKRFDQVQKGDELVLLVTEALAINVSAAAL